MAEVLRAVWRYRTFVMSAVLNDLRSRFARSRFGVAWVILQPLAQVIIFSTILSNVLAARLEGVDNPYAYSTYLLSGLLCWSLFADVLTRQLSVFVDNASILKKVNIPRSALPVIGVGSALVNHLALMAVVLVALPILGFRPNVYWLWLIPMGLLTVALGTGIGLFLGTFNVFLRDVGQATMVCLQFVFWMTPVVYPVSIVPDGAKALLSLNPVYPLVAGYQDLLVYARPPQLSLVPTSVFAIVTLGLAWFTFRRASSELVDSL